MRACLIAAALLVGGCNDTVISRGNDLAGFVGGNMDMGRDLSLPAGQKYGCNGFVGCYTDCFATNPSTATASGCKSSCEPKSQPGASDTFDAALQCGQLWCISKKNTVASYKCMVSGSSLVNMDGTQISDSDPGTGLKACGACLANALASLFGDTCSSTTDCNPPACSTEMNACLSDLP
jgi:hypothetical protein